MRCRGTRLSSLFRMLGGLPLLLGLVAASAGANDTNASLSLELPVPCRAAEGCLIQNYFDHDSGPGFVDYHCGRLGYDGHRGTDFRLRNLKEMAAGVPVRAAAPGRVKAIRDEIPDLNLRDRTSRDEIANRGAGNTVIVLHGKGWATGYSHLKLGSVRVKPGDMVSTGQILGEIGLSGLTEFPHLHFSVRRHGVPVDPFTGSSAGRGCGGERESLWSPRALEKLSYRPTGLIQAGFTDTRPDSRGIESGEMALDSLGPDASAIVFWVEVYGVREGDVQQMSILDPRGSVLVGNEQVLRRNQALRFSFVGKRRTRTDWPLGRYQANFRLLRRSSPVLEISRDLEVRSSGSGDSSL